LDAIIPIKQVKQSLDVPGFVKPKPLDDVQISQDSLPKSMRVAIRGIGGQGNLFFGKVLSAVAMRTPYSETHIVKGDTHGMAQLGGPVISTFSCGEVFSPVLAPNSVEVLVVMEIVEILRPGFIELLKPGGTIIMNKFTSLPVTAKKEDYPELAAIEKFLVDYNIIEIDAYKLAYDLGDKSGKSANVIVIGLLSVIKPFDNIPEKIWQAAILSVSPNDFSKAINNIAFTKGREYIIEQKKEK
jgi:indolepyruvate ferredoxin oxidoreductase alpha subunit